MNCGTENYDVVAEQKRLEHEDGPDERDKMDTQLRVSQQRRDEGHPNDNVGGRRPHWRRISTRHPPWEEDVTTGLLKMMWQPTGRLQPRAKRAESHGTRGSKGHAKQTMPISTAGTAQLQKRDCWDRRADLRRRVPDWRYILTANTTKKPTRARGREEQWVDSANVVWPEVTGLCGFWDGSCQHGVCGAGMLIKISTQTLGCATNHKRMWTRARPEFLRC